MREELLKGLSAEQIAKIKACKNNEELLALAKKEGVELNEEQLSAINGGACSSGEARKCPNCGSTNVKLSSGTLGKSINGVVVTYYKCKDCGKVFAEV